MRAAPLPMNTGSTAFSPPTSTSLTNTTKHNPTNPPRDGNDTRLGAGHTGTWQKEQQHMGIEAEAEGEAVVGNSPRCKKKQKQGQAYRNGRKTAPKDIKWLWFGRQVKHYSHNKTFRQGCCFPQSTPNPWFSNIVFVNSTLCVLFWVSQAASVVFAKAHTRKAVSRAIVRHLHTKRRKHVRSVMYTEFMTENGIHASPSAKSADGISSVRDINMLPSTKQNYLAQAMGCVHEYFILVIQPRSF